MDAILETHTLECLLALQVVLLIDLVQILYFLSPLVLFSEVAQVAIHLLLSLSDAVADLPCLLLLLILLHFIDFSQSLVCRDFVWINAVGLQVLLHLLTLRLNFVNLVNVLA